MGRAVNVGSLLTSCDLVASHTPPLGTLLQGRYVRGSWHRYEVLGARTLLGAPGLTTRNKKLLEARNYHF